MQRKIAVLECEDAKKWEGYTELLWKEALCEPGDSWTLYKACEGHLPTPEQAAQFDAIIVAGSHYSAYEEHEWIHKLLELLPKLAAQGTRMYGCCFGCQILARALGGSVGPNPDGQFVLTIEQIQPTADLQKYPKLHAAVQQALAAGAATGGSNSMLLGEAAADHSASRASAAAALSNSLDRLSITQSSTSADASMVTGGECNGKAETAAAAAAGDAAGHAAARAAAAGGCFRLIESHGDQVLQLPAAATLLASSGTATNELWCWGDNILASQFHVEFDEPLVIEKIWSSLRDVGRLDAQQAQQSRQVLEAGGQMNAAMLQVVKHFLKHGIDNVPAVQTNNSSGINGTDGSSGKAPSSSDSNNSKSSTTEGPTSDNSSNSNGANGSGSSGASAASPGDAAAAIAEAAAAAAEATEPEQQQQPAGDACGVTEGGSSSLIQSAAAPRGVTAAGGDAADVAIAEQQASAALEQQQASAALEQQQASAALEQQEASAALQQQEASAALEQQQASAAPAAEAVTLLQASSGSCSMPPAPPSMAADNTTWPPGLDASFRLRAERDSKSLTGLSDAQRSGCSSPTAASEYSVAASITSTSSTVPFSHIAYQRKQQKREFELHDHAKCMVNDVSAAFDLRMDAYSLDFEAVQQLNATAADQYMVTAEIAAALGQFAHDLGSRQAAVREALAALPQLDRQLKILEAAVGQLDKRSKELEAKVGVAGSSSSKSAYEYLTSSFSRAGTAIGSTGAGGCLGGGALPKQFD